MKTGIIIICYNNENYIDIGLCVNYLNNKALRYAINGGHIKTAKLLLNYISKHKQNIEFKYDTVKYIKLFQLIF